MTNKQAQCEEIVALFNKAVPVLIDEGLDGSAKDVEKLIRRVKAMGYINSSHKNNLYSVLRMMLESNTYYDSKASEDLDKAFVLIKAVLGEKL